MYSPKINPELISPLYHEAKKAGIPMTKLVNQIIYEHLSGIEPDPEPEEKPIPMGFYSTLSVPREAS